MSTTTDSIKIFVQQKQESMATYYRGVDFDYAASVTGLNAVSLASMAFAPRTSAACHYRRDRVCQHHVEMGESKRCG